MNDNDTRECSSLVALYDEEHDALAVATISNHAQVITRDQDVERLGSKSQRAESAQRRAGRASPPCPVPSNWTVVRCVTIGTCHKFQVPSSWLVWCSERGLQSRIPLLMVSVASLLKRELDRRAV